MKTMRLFMYALIVGAMTLTACSTDGEDGMDGADGMDGIAGMDGMDGAPGEDGADGVDGEDGEDGEDGNANVATYLFDTSALSGTFFSIEFPALTVERLENDAILSYLFSGISYYPIPGISFTDLIEVELRVNEFDIYFYERTDGTPKNIPVGKYTQLKVIIIESSETNGFTPGKEDILAELKTAGIDSRDYYAVCDYYGIDY